MSASVELACIDPKQVGELWPHVSGWVRRAAERGGGDFAAIERDVLGSNSYLWVAVTDGAILACAVTKVTGQGDDRLCTIVACGGHDWPRFGHLIEGLEQYARDEGCAAVEIHGRPGWARILKYRITHVVLRKELSDGRVATEWPEVRTSCCA